MASGLTGHVRAPRRRVGQKPGRTPDAPGMSNPGTGDSGRSSFSSISFHLYCSSVADWGLGREGWEVPGCWEVNSGPV